MLTLKEVQALKMRRAQIVKDIEQTAADSDTDAAEAFRARADLKDELAVIEQQLGHWDARQKKINAASNLPERFRRRTFETFETRVFSRELGIVKKYAQTFEANDGDGLLIIGGTGTGKTHLAASVVNHLTARGYGAVFTTAVGMFENLRDFKGHDQDCSNRSTELLKAAQLLVIDDLGKEKVTEWNREKLYEIVNDRYENFKAMIITSNLSPAEIEKSVGEAVYSRLCEMCRLIVMDGDDFRKN